MRRAVLLLTGLLLVAGGCSEADSEPAARTAAEGPSSPPSDEREPPPTIDPGQLTLEPRPSPRPEPLRGIDASHHQGAIDWAAVAGDGISFAYLKASEGTTYVDPTFAGHRQAAQAQGIRVGGYHYFQLCSSGVEQAEHFAAVLGDAGGPRLPPAVDLELAGSCDLPPPRSALLAEVVDFLEVVAERTGQEPVVYLYPELEAEYGFAGELRGYRQWVRSLDGRPGREWWMWQQTDSGAVAGIAGPVDVNVLLRPSG